MSPAVTTPQVKRLYSVGIKETSEGRMANTMTTKELAGLLPLTHEEQAMCYAIEHNEHIHIAQALAYLHWARARGCTLDAPCQTTLAVQDAPVVEEARAIVDAELPTISEGQTWLNSLPFDHEEEWHDDEEGALT